MGCCSSQPEKKKKLDAHGFSTAPPKIERKKSSQRVVRDDEAPPRSRGNSVVSLNDDAERGQPSPSASMTRRGGSLSHAMRGSRRGLPLIRKQSLAGSMMSLEDTLRLDESGRDDRSEAGQFEDDSDVDEPDAAAAALDVRALYEKFNTGLYKTAFRGLQGKLGKLEGPCEDSLFCMLGLAALHGLGGENWQSPQNAGTFPKQVLSDALAALEVMATSEGDAAAPAALLALAEYHMSNGNACEEIRYRTLAAAANPLGQLKLAMFQLQELDRKLEEDQVAYTDYTREVQQQVNELETLAREGDGLVAGHAAKKIWGSYYRGKDPIGRDMVKAKELLEVVVKNELSAVSQRMYHRKLVKVQQRINEERGIKTTLARGSSASPMRKTSLSRSTRGAGSLQRDASMRGGALRRMSSRGGELSPKEDTLLSRRMSGFDSPAKTGGSRRSSRSRSPLPDEEELDDGAPSTVAPSRLGRRQSRSRIAREREEEDNATAISHTSRKESRRARKENV